MVCKRITISNNYDNCAHNNKIQTNSHIVCKDCGLVLDNILADSSYTLKISPHYSRGSTQYVGLGNVTNQVCTLGTTIDHNTQKYLKDCNGKLLKPDSQKLFRRIKAKNKRIPLINKEKEFRILSVLKKIGEYLDLSDTIVNGAAYRYRIIISKYNKKIINNVTCLCFCIWDTIRFYRTITSFEELYKAFKAYGHSVNKKLLMRDGCLYNETLKIAGIPKSSAKHPRDYISRHLAEIKNNKYEVKKRLEKKTPGAFPSVEHFLMKIERVCNDILNKLDNPIKQYSANPLIVAAACIYFADLIVAKNKNKRKVLTQKVIAKLCNVREYSIRNIYVNFLKLYTPVDKNMIRKKKYNFDSKEIIKRYKAGEAPREIAETYGCHPDTILKLLKKNNVPIRKSNPDYTFDTEKMKKQYSEEGLTLTEIAAEYGCSYPTVRRHLAKNNVPIRPRGMPGVIETKLIKEKHEKKTLIPTQDWFSKPTIIEEGNSCQ